MKRLLAAGLVLLLVSGCRSSRDGDEWNRRYVEPDPTLQVWVEVGVWSAMEAASAVPPVDAAGFGFVRAYLRVLSFWAMPARPFPDARKHRRDS